MELLGYIVAGIYHILIIFMDYVVLFRDRIFSRVRPFYERAVSELDRSMHRSLWV